MFSREAKTWEAERKASYFKICWFCFVHSIFYSLNILRQYWIFILQMMQLCLLNSTRNHVGHCYRETTPRHNRRRTRGRKDKVSDDKQGHLFQQVYFIRWPPRNHLFVFLNLSNKYIILLQSMICFAVWCLNWFLLWGQALPKQFSHDLLQTGVGENWWPSTKLSFQIL